MFLVYRFFIIIIKKEIFTWILFLALVTVTDLTLVRLALLCLSTSVLWPF